MFEAALSETEDKETVVGVLRDLGVTKVKATKSVNDHFNRVANAKKRLHDKNNQLTFEDALSLSDATRVGKMINEWLDLQSRRRAIFQLRIKFEEIINNLFSGKELRFDERNTPMVHLESGEAVDIKTLSSGEKQLFILLGEALLQEDRSVVFVSDEPELSLHVI